MRRDTIAGGALVVGGLAYAASAVVSLPLGSLNQMGPGMFPLGLGLLLAIFGVGILVPALSNDQTLPPVEPRALFFVLLALVAFALLIRPMGLFPPVIATTVISSFAMPGRRPISLLLLCLALLGLTWFIFIFLLSLQIPLIRWRF